MQLHNLVTCSLVVNLFVTMAYQLYRNTTLGNSLQESLDELIQVKAMLFVGCRLAEVSHFLLPTSLPKLQEFVQLMKICYMLYDFFSHSLELNCSI